MTQKSMSARGGSLPAGRHGAFGGKKVIIFTFVLAGLVLFGQAALAFESNAIVNLEAPYATIYKGTFDNLVLDFSFYRLRIQILIFQQQILALRQRSRIALLYPASNADYLCGLPRYSVAHECVL